MRKLLFIIILFFSTSVLAVGWEKFQPSPVNSLDYWIGLKFEIVHTRAQELSIGQEHIHTLVKKESQTSTVLPNVVICTVTISVGPAKPLLTQCFVER
jgi:hypothetical protein